MASSMEEDNQPVAAEAGSSFDLEVRGKRLF